MGGMKAILRGKNWVIVWGLVALFILILLASGLGEVAFDQPFLANLENVYTPKPINSSEVRAVSWFRYLVIGLVVLLFILFLGPIRPRTSRDLIKQILRFALFAFVTMLFLGRFAQANPFLLGELEDASSAQGGGGAPARGGQSDPFDSGPVPGVEDEDLPF